MKFCSKCDNMYYIKIDESNNNELIYYCRMCKHEEKNFDKSMTRVSKTNIKKKNIKYNHLINKYTKFDPTLPNITTIRCPNPRCKTNTEDIEKNVVFMRYDNENLKFLYICFHCDMVWKND